jgi:hypothetical protein
VSFKNTLVLLTSNIGSRVIAAGTGGGLAVFGSRRQMLGADEEADETLQVRKGWGLFHSCFLSVFRFYSPHHTSFLTGLLWW